MSRSSWVVLAAAALVAGACADDTPGDPDAAAGADAPVADAMPDAGGGACPGQLLFTGEYVDWDSTPQMFLGIFDATVAEVGNPDNSAQTAPNGRAVLCLPATADSEVSVTQADYVPVIYSVDAEANAAGAYALKGLEPARMTELFTGWALTPDAGAAQLEVEVRSFPSGAPVTGAVVTIGNAHAGAFTADGTGEYVSSAQLDGGAHVFFANVEAGGGTTTVTVTPPAGTSCVGRDSVVLNAGEIAAVLYACD
jgi:hypothetical protein